MIILSRPRLRYRLGCYSVATRLRLESEWLQRLLGGCSGCSGCREVAGKLQRLQPGCRELMKTFSPIPTSSQLSKIYKSFSPAHKIVIPTTPPTTSPYRLPTIPVSLTGPYRHTNDLADDVSTREMMKTLYFLMIPNSTCSTCSHRATIQPLQPSSDRVATE